METADPNDPFAEWLADVVRDDVVVAPYDINREAQENMWAFSLTPEQVPTVTIAALQHFAAEVTAARSKWLATRGFDPMILYWWHDEMAGQLRFSLVSASHGQLPFGCKIQPAANLRLVLDSWLESDYLHGIPWHELSEIPFEPPDDSFDYTLLVWSERLPKGE